jgi:hypothetical protein
MERLGGCRRHNPEHRSLAEARCEGDLVRQRVDHSPHDRQSQAQSPSMPIAVQRVGATVEFLVDRLMLVGRNAGAGIDDIDEYAVPARAGGDQNAAALGVAQCVRDDVL